MNGALTPGRFVEALKQKRHADRRRTYLLLGVIGAAVLILGIGVWLAFFSPVFAANKVTVSGLTVLTEDQVTTAAAVETGVPLALTDTGAIEQRVGELSPVKSVEVNRALPDTLEIAVTERTLAFQRARDGQFDWVDDEGLVFHHSAEAVADAIVVNTSTADQRLLTDLATVARNVPPTVRPQVVSISAEAVDGITLALTENRTVNWGSAEESELKGEVVAALLSVEASIYDVSAPRHPTTR